MRLLKIIWDTLGVRRFIIGSAIIVSVNLYAWAVDIVTRSFGVLLPAIPSSTISLVVAAGFIILTLAQRIRRVEDDLQPNIELTFDLTTDCIKRLEHLVGFVDMKDPIFHPVTYYRFRAKNKSIRVASNCSAFLLGVHRKRDGIFERTKYSDNLRLAWAASPSTIDGFASTDLFKDVVRYVDLFSYDEKTHELKLAVETDLIAHKGIFDRGGSYKLTMQVSDSSDHHEQIAICFDVSENTGITNIYACAI